MAAAPQPITYFDADLYHFQNIKWLSEYGAEAGVGIVHDRFDFTPAWFALAAPFDAGPFEMRAAAVADGFTLLVACLHALVCVRRCASGARLIPLLLAAGAVGVKLNALPLLVVACVYYVAGGGLTVRRVLSASGAVTLLLLPALAHRVVVSGCPLYPSKVLCLDVPWAVGVRQAELHTRAIREWARWEGTGLPWADGWGWVVP